MITLAPTPDPVVVTNTADLPQGWSEILGTSIVVLLPICLALALFLVLRPTYRRLATERRRAFELQILATLADATDERTVPGLVPGPRTGRNYHVRLSLLQAVDVPEWRRWLATPGGDLGSRCKAFLGRQDLGPDYDRAIRRILREDATAAMRRRMTGPSDAKARAKVHARDYAALLRERRGDAYLNLLHLTGETGLWLARVVPMYQVGAGSPVPPSPRTEDPFGITAARLNAVGSGAIKERYAKWYAAVGDAIRAAEDVSHGHGEKRESLLEAWEREQSARRELGAAIDHELATARR